MAGPKIDGNLDVFCTFNFANKSPRLALTKTNPPTLVSINKNSKVQADDSLAKVVKFISENQDNWLKASNVNSIHLQTQLARLSKKVSSYNQNHKYKPAISYKNPARWSIKFEITIEKDTKDKIHDHIISTVLTRQFSYDRLSTQKQVYDVCSSIFSEFITVEVKCLSKKCTAQTHNVTITPNDLFEKAIPHNEKWKQDCPKTFLAEGEEGKNQSVSITGHLRNGEKITKLLKGIHPEPNHNSSSHTTDDFLTNLVLTSHFSNGHGHHHCGGGGTNCGGSHSSSHHHHHHHHSCGSSCGNFSSCGGAGGGHHHS